MCVWNSSAAQTINAGSAPAWGQTGLTVAGFHFNLSNEHVGSFKCTSFHFGRMGMNIVSFSHFNNIRWKFSVWRDRLFVHRGVSASIILLWGKPWSLLLACVINLSLSREWTFWQHSKTQLSLQISFQTVWLCGMETVLSPIERLLSDCYSAQLHLISHLIFRLSAAHISCLLCCSYILI